MDNFISGLAPLMSGMLDYREALGFSRRTHMTALRNFDRYCADNAPEAKTIEKKAVLDWIKRETGKKTQNIGAKASAVRLLGQYITAIGKKAYVLPEGYAVSKSPAFTPYIFTDDELSALFTAIDNLGDFGGDHTELIAPVMFRLIYTCGLRPNEGRELERANVNLETGEIFITKTKRKKERIVVMSDDMLNLCKEYDRRRADFANDSPFFFPTRSGEPYDEKRLDRLFKRCWELANPTVNPKDLPNVRLYDLRHRMASAALSRWLDEGADLNNKVGYLRAYMGHEEISETAYYIHILPENLVKSAGIEWLLFTHSPKNAIIDKRNAEERLKCLNLTNTRGRARVTHG